MLLRLLPDNAYWIPSAGGPLMFGPDALWSQWHGIHGQALDYKAAGNVPSWVGPLVRYGKTAAVFSEPNCFEWVPASANIEGYIGVFFRLEYVSELYSTPKALDLSQLKIAQETITIDNDRSEWVFSDASSDHEEALKFGILIALPPKPFQVMSYFYFETDDDLVTAHVIKTDAH